MKIIKISKIGKIYHVGTMDMTKKSKFSLEGNGLSVSTCPDEWRRITEGHTCGECFQLKKKDATFLDFHRLTGKDRDEIKNWAIENDYVNESALYKYHFQDESDNDAYLIFETYEEAVSEAYGEDEPEETIVSCIGIIPTEKLKKEIFVQVDLANCFDLITTLYAEKVLNLDGVWWNDALDVYSYSAPRGVIFNSRLKEFAVSKI